MRGIGANWLVNIGIWQACSASDTFSKMAAVWLPVFTFVGVGLEHSVANMFLLPRGLRGGAPPLMATAFTATATYLGAAAALRTAAGSDVVASLGGDESCLAEPQLTQLAQFLTVVYFLASSLL